MVAKIDTLGQRIKRFRLLNDIRQEDMSDKMGVSRATLINYEKGYTTINIDVLEKLKEAYPSFDDKDQKKQKPKIVEDNIIDFKLLFKVLFNKRKHIIISTLTAMICGLSTSFTFTKFYSSQISLYPAKKDSFQRLGQFQSLAASLGVNSNNDTEHFNIPDVVKSRLIAGKVLNQKWLFKNDKKANLIEIWGFYDKPWYKNSSDFNVDSSAVLSKAIKKFKNHINVSEDKITGLINIITKFEDPNISSKIANYIVDEVQNYIQKENSAQSKREKLFISERLKIVKNELEDSELNLKIFKERNRGYENSPELFMVFSRLYRESEVKKEVYMTLQQELELARIEEVKQKPILHILDRAVPLTTKSSPNRLFFIIIFGIFGSIFSTILALFKY